jgi:uncharacterized membrane protein YbhN (UPF0104 family)
VIAPGGVGVRELTYVWLLAHVLPRHELQAGAVASRMVTVIAELLVLVVVSRRTLEWRRRSRSAGLETGADVEQGAP